MRGHLNDGMCVLCGNKGTLGDLWHQCGTKERPYVEGHDFEPWNYPEGVARGMPEVSMQDDGVADEEGGSEDP